MRVVVLLLLACCVTFAQRRSPEDDNGPDIRDPQMVAAGAKLYSISCAGCHGKTGGGGRGPNLNDGTFIRRSNNARLFELIKRGLPGTDMPPFPGTDDKVWQLVAHLRSLNAPAIDFPPPGDSEAGRSVFFGKGGCSNCHAIGGQGGTLGPDFTELGATRSVRQIREGILDPNRRIPDGYRPVKVVTASGQTLQGVAKNFTNYSLQMIDRNGTLHLFDTRELKEMSVDVSRSPMPADYAKRLTSTEINDVVAYLSKQAVRSRPDRTLTRRTR